MSRRLALALGLLACAACAGRSSPPAAGDGISASAAGPRADRNTITRAELDARGQGMSTLFDYVSTRHYDWLRNNQSGRIVGGNASTGISVYVDNVRFGDDPTALRQIPLGSVVLARKLSPSEAEGRFGSNNNSGTIAVYTSLALVR